MDTSAKLERCWKFNPGIKVRVSRKQGKDQRSGSVIEKEGHGILNC